MISLQLKEFFHISFKKYPNTSRWKLIHKIDSSFFHSAKMRIHTLKRVHSKEPNTEPGPKTISRSAIKSILFFTTQTFFGTAVRGS
jgi:hypothetical protein